MAIHKVLTVSKGKVLRGFVDHWIIRTLGMLGETLI